MKEREIVKDSSYQEEMQRFQTFLNEFYTSDHPLQLILKYDFSKYPYDLSVIDHNK